MNAVIHWLQANKIKVGAVLFWTLLLVAIRQVMQAQDMTFIELTNALADTLTGTWYGPLIYIAVYLLRPLVLFPASLLTALAGNLFGLWFGFAVALVAGTLSAAIPYAVGRWFSPEPLKNTNDEAASRLRNFVDLLKKNPFQAVLTMRLLYLPYDAVSVLAGSLRIPFWQFALATAIGNIGGSFAFVGIGASIDGDLSSGQLSLDPAVLAFSVTILVVSLGISRYLNQRDNPADALSDVQQKTSLGSEA